MRATRFNNAMEHYRARRASVMVAPVVTAALAAALVANDASGQVQQVVAWGTGAAAVVPSGVNNNVMSISAASNLSAALLGNGTIVRWGDSALSIPYHNDYESISVGALVGVALRRNGAVVCLRYPGFDYFCNGSPLTVPPGSQCTSAHGNASVLSPDGAVLGCWGQGGSGECSIPAQQYSQIAHGYQHGVGLLPDGTVLCWGQNAYGQCTAPAKLAAIRVAAGQTISAAVRTSGTVVVWGYSQMGPVQPPADLWDVVDLAGGDHFFAALRGDGSVRCWGYNGGGQCNVPIGLDRVVAIAAGASHVVAMRLPCAGDISGNGVTDGVDLAALIGAWGTSGTGQFDSDINNDGVVDGADLSILLSSWGACP